MLSLSNLIPVASIATTPKEANESKTATGEQCKETEDEKDVPSIEVEISTDDNSDDEQLISQLDKQLTAVWKERGTDGDQE